MNFFNRGNGVNHAILLRVCLLAAVVTAVPVAREVHAQGRQGPGGRQGAGRAGGPGAPAPQDAISPAELQDLMDTMVVMQAERELRLTDEQFRQFLTRLRGLQAIRRRAENQRNRALMELRRLMQPQNATADEGQIRERLKALDDADAQAAAEIRQARSAVDQVLDVRQQARFRLLEEQIERRKLDLFARSRQPNLPR